MALAKFRFSLRSLFPIARDNHHGDTTILIATLKIFDIVFVMTNGLYGTEVMASQQYKQMFKFQDFGRGSAVAIILLITVIPVMIYNLRQFREKEAF